MVESSTYAIGIDLGTTYSCVAVWKDNRVQIIDIIPSIVAFTSEGAKLVGKPALAQ
jgi:molecular chaperone DnaK (HSP70)